MGGGDTLKIHTPVLHAVTPFSTMHLNLLSLAQIPFKFRYLAENLEFHINQCLQPLKALGNKRGFEVTNSFRKLTNIS